MRHAPAWSRLAVLAVLVAPVMAGHPDLSGNWEGPTGAGFLGTYPQGQAPAGSINAGMMTAEMAARALGQMQATGKGRAAATYADISNAPAWRSEDLRARADALWQNGSETDGVVLCNQPGLPRVGAPAKIVQAAHELVFLYADPSGMVWRVIPTDGRAFRARLDPNPYGDSVGHWEGNTLVVETRNLGTETWFGEYGYFHSNQMTVVERLTRKGNVLTWQATVNDPVNLSAPWVKPPVLMHHTDKQIEVPDRCVPEPVTDGHHEQRIP